MVQYQCPRCGRHFTTDQQMSPVRCPFCGNVFNVAFTQQTPPQFGQQYAYGGPQPMPTSDIGVFDVGPSGKSRGVAGLLAILLGPLGVHYFYIGKHVGGLVCLLVSIGSCGILAPIVSILTLVQGIMMFAMRSDEFERKFVNTTSAMPMF
ncbi:MAG: NINE protein [Muribaculaceae bacterium]|nr:NINE protein [Muribaculaceae bacterium]